MKIVHISGRWKFAHFFINGCASFVIKNDVFEAKLAYIISLIHILKSEYHYM